MDGVDASQDLNQTDPLGLSDDERDLINAAVEAKESNGGKVIVMLNNANAMEIDEIKNYDGVAAILEVGLPGGYGFYGVADILSGEANPSGHQTDTYAVTNANSPAAQNLGNYEWINADPTVNINAEEVEAELKEKFADLIATKNKGQIMKTVMPAFKGRADGKVINQIVAKMCQ